MYTYIILIIIYAMMPLYYIEISTREEVKLIIIDTKKKHYDCALLYGHIDFRTLLLLLLLYYY